MSLKSPAGYFFFCFPRVYVTMMQDLETFSGGVMEQLTVYAISQTDAAPVVAIAETALRKLGRTMEIRSYHNVDNQLDLERILLRAVNAGRDPLILYMFEDDSLSVYLKNFCDLRSFRYIDLLNPIVCGIENRFSERVGIDLRSIAGDDDVLFQRVKALEFATRYDDGKDASGLLIADLCLIGVSRTTKTPLSMYLASKNYRVVNVPLVPESPPPSELYEIAPGKIFGLTVSAQSLVATRKERLKSLGLPATAEYASLNRVLVELNYAGEIMKELGCPIIDVTSRSVEETADIIVRHLSKRDG